MLACQARTCRRSDSFTLMVPTCETHDRPELAHTGPTRAATRTSGLRRERSQQGFCACSCLTLLLLTHCPPERQVTLVLRTSPLRFQLCDALTDESSGSQAFSPREQHQRLLIPPCCFCVLTSADPGRHQRGHGAFSCFLDPQELTSEPGR